VIRLPSVSYEQIVRAFQRDGWVMIRQRGSHIRLEKRTEDRTLKLTVPAHRPVKRSTLSHILKQANITAERFLQLL
jgi:predicted RNA binding protein YcfA (HicA-like mRNA interferase family)